MTGGPKAKKRGKFSNINWAGHHLRQRRLVTVHHPQRRPGRVTGQAWQALLRESDDRGRGSGNAHALSLFHWNKVEDIINRGGGQLVIRLYNGTAENGLGDSEINVSVDGVRRRVKAGNTVLLDPGESITLPPRLYHEFWGVRERVMAGEVSLVNDDRSDNYFHKPIGRFPKIEEDETPLHLLVTDYPSYYQSGANRTPWA
jgi:hypothetical protein